MHSRDLLKGPSETSRVIHDAAQVRNVEPGPGPILPIHVLRDPSPPGTRLIHLLGRVETLDEERRDVEVFLRI
eukprot:14349142-Alexandrium_andersonii.AAC.1